MSKTDWKEVYQRIAKEKKSYHANKHGMWGISLLGKNIPAFPNMKIVDLGCGDGSFANYLLHSSNATSADGIDIVRVRGVETNVNFIQMDLDESVPLPYADNSIGLITAFDSMEHLSEEGLRFRIPDIYRCICPNGRFYMSAPNWSSVFHFKDGTTMELHRTMKPEKWWIDLCSEAGFRHTESLWVNKDKTKPYMMFAK